MTSKNPFRISYVAGALALAMSSVSFADLANPLDDDDVDGVNNGAEQNMLYTDPLEQSFGQLDGIAGADFTDPAVYGEYSGVIYDPNDGLVGKIVLKVDRKGGFSGKVYGAGSSGSIRGKFDEFGKYFGQQLVLGTFFPSLTLRKPANSEDIRIQGTLNTTFGVDQYFELRKPRFSKLDPAPSGHSTFVIDRYHTPALDPTDVAQSPWPGAGPAGATTSALGSGYGLVDIQPAGSFRVKAYLPDGTPTADRGNLIFGLSQDDGFGGVTYSEEVMPIYNSVKKKKGVLVSIASNMRFRTLNGSNYDGPCRILRLPTSNNDLFAAGFDEERTAIGSAYFVPGFASLPLPSIGVTANNVRYSFSPNPFTGGDLPGTWNTNGTITIPSTQNYTVNSKVSNKTGELTGSIKVNNPALGTKISGTFRGVVQQESNIVVGFFNAPFDFGGVTLAQNDGTAPAVTIVSPTSIKAEQPGTTVQVDVQTAGAWAVSIPTGLNWVTANVAQGSGNGQVFVTVLPNDQGWERSGTITIAGRLIKITQKAFFNN